MIRLIALYCTKIALCLLLFTADITKALQTIIMYNFYGSDGNSVRFCTSLLFGNVLIVKNGEFYSMPVKGKRSTPQDVQLASNLYKVYHDTVVNQIESARLGIEMQIDNYGINQIFTVKHAVKNGMDDINFEYKTDLRDLSKFQTSLIITSILFCDDTTLSTDCQMKLQKSI